ncbi:MAG: penicillin-binding protein 2 [bacterium]
MLKLRSSKDFEGIEPHEIFLDSLAQKREAEMGFPERKLEVPLLKKILQGFLAVSFLLILILFIKTFQLQITQGREFTLLAEDNKFIISQIQAERGVIYDQNLNQLVFNQPTFDLICQKNELPREAVERDKVLKEVSRIIKKELEGMREAVEESDLTQVLVAENLDHQTLILLETKIKELPGFELRNNVVRNYQDSKTFSHLIGYTGKIRAEELEDNLEFYSINDWVGRSGIESFYEEVLRKNPGQLRVERDARGHLISKEIIQFPESGKSLVLWLDSDLQKQIEAELEKVLRAVGSKKALAVALNPKTGGVLSLVSLPGFDNNLFQKGASSEELNELLEDPYKLESLFNRVVSGRYLTGSTIKPLIASAALEEGIILPEKSLYCQGNILIINPWDETSSSTKKDWATHGWTDMRKAIAESCNVYFYTIGGGYENQEGLGPTKIKEYLSLFGWSEKTGIDLPGEAAGFIPDKEWKKETWDQNWWDGDTYNLSIGQGFLQITPLEVAASFAAIANGGILYQPQVAKEIVSSEKEVVQEIESKIIRQNFIDPQILDIVRQGMRQAVTGFNSPQASAVLLNSLPVKAAAKTGTAELGNNHYHNWITVFAPYDDPEIVLTIMIEDIKELQVAALPAAKAILEWYFSQ